MILILENEKIGKKGFSFIAILLIVLISFNLTPILNQKMVFEDKSNQLTTPLDEGVKLSDLSLSQYSGVGKAQNVTEYGESFFLNNDINITNNENASVIIPKNWQANTISCNVTNIYEYGAIVMNQTFDNGIDQKSWTNYTTGNPAKFTVGYYSNPTGSNDSIYMKLDEDGGNWQDTSSLVNYSFPLFRDSIPYEDWYIKYSVKWVMTDNSWRDALPGGSKYVMGLKFFYKDGTSTFREFNLKRPAEIVNNTWYHITMLDLISPFPELYEYNPPANVSMYFSFGVKNAAYSPVGSLTIYYDNISFEIQAIPKPSTMDLRITDNAIGGLENQPVLDFPKLFGKGNIILEGDWLGGLGGTTYEFSFTSNSTGYALINTNFHVIATSHSFTTTSIGSTGTDFIVENGSKIIWTMNIPITIPGSYSINYYFNVSKPSNWNVTQVLDPYSNNRIAEVIGAGVGNSILTIPNNIVTNGIWKIVAEAPNYVELAHLFRRDASVWYIQDTFHVQDQLKINASINTSLIPSIDNTAATLKVFAPNGSLWYQKANSVNIDGTVEFPEINLGKNNASAGKYSAQIFWHDYDINMSQVGFSLLEFKVIHNTNLTAVNSYFEQLAGEPFLLKVKFVDFDFNESIPFAVVTYTSSFGISGTLIYQGLGIYFGDIDTSSLELGDYYFSFNATKQYYENQTKVNLIHLKIIAQPLALEVPNTVINGIGNDYITCQINVTGALSGALISSVNISTNWFNPYTVIDHNNGTYSLNFSTWNLPSQGIIEYYTISIFANKTNYKETSRSITIEVFPIQTSIGVNKSVLFVDVGSVVDIKINYTVEGSGMLILGANCSVTWPGSYSLISDAQGFVLRLNTSGLAIDTYSALINMEKAAYETAYENIIIIINRIEIKVNTMNFQGFIEAFSGDSILLRLNLTEFGTELLIENATIFYSLWNLDMDREFGYGYFDYISNGIYELELTLPNMVGNYEVTLTISKVGTIYKQTEFSFNISIKERALPNYVFWVIIYGLLGIICIFGIIGLRSFVILPRKRKKESELLANTQRYKDIMNIDALYISQKNSGLCIYSKDYYYSPEEDQSTLLTGFIQAITILSKKAAGKETLEETPIILKDFKGVDSMIELDFKYFNFFIIDYKNIRTTFILKEKASERFKNQAAQFISDIDSELSEKLENWNGELSEFNKLIPSFLEESFYISYREWFKLNHTKFINRIKEEEKLSKMELRLLNVIISMTKEREEFYLDYAINSVHEKNKDKVIEALERLIELKVVIPS